MQPDLVSKFKKYKGVTQWFSAYLAVMKAWYKHQHQNKRKRREKRKKEKGRKEGEEKGKDLAFTLSLKDSDDHSQSEKVHLCMVVDFEHADKAGRLLGWSGRGPGLQFSTKTEPRQGRTTSPVEATRSSLSTDFWTERREMLCSALEL